ncbi:hypothetical protein HZH68_013631 [Vespula germanica]|uniref:Uncharacterized protein n=1 Tax=Vespula germanica TaxID=30212 RepID=A0A834JDP9_VESGE|nr:hypothetical protein HZH68_013631 [Vespula germanica]
MVRQKENGINGIETVVWRWIGQRAVVIEISDLEGRFFKKEVDYVSARCSVKSVCLTLRKREGGTKIDRENDRGGGRKGRGRRGDEREGSRFLPVEDVGKRRWERAAFSGSNVVAPARRLPHAPARNVTVEPV